MQLFRERQTLPTATGQSLKVSGLVVHDWLAPERDGDRESETKEETGTRTGREAERERLKMAAVLFTDLL